MKIVPYLLALLIVWFVIISIFIYGLSTEHPWMLLYSHLLWITAKNNEWKAYIIDQYRRRTNDWRKRTFALLRK